MAAYDPGATPTFDAYEANTFDDGEDEQFNQPEADEEEDEDYDPSAFNLGNGQHDATYDVEPQAQYPSKPSTIGGFVVDDDEEDEEDQQDAAHPPPSQLNGTEGAQAAADTLAQITAVASEPSQEDASAQSAAPLTGSSSLVSPQPTSSDTSSTTLPISAPAPSLQLPPDQGKQELSATASAVQSATATPVPGNAAPPAQSQQQSNSIPPTPTTQRLPHDKVGQLEDRIKEDPKADLDAWRELIKHYREKGQLDNARKVYERFFEVFPSAASMWVDYAQMELAENNLRYVEVIFGKCLLQLPSMDMWIVYLDYLRRIHPLNPDPDGTKRGIISQAFDLLLDHVGIDPDAGKLWRDYIDFVKSGPGVIGGTGWQDAQKMDLLRKAYQKAIRLPHGELTKLWKEYDNFELGINKANGRKFLQEQSPHYMEARTARTQLDQKLAGLDRTSLPKLPPLYGCAGEDEFATQVEKWRGWAAWEKEDPLVIKDDDVAAYRKRILWVYRQATMQLRFYPGIWFEAAEWCFEQGIEEMETQGVDFLDKGIEACPESVLLTLKKADRVESGLDKGNDDDVAIRNGEKLDVVFESCHKALYALHKRMVERVNKEVAKVQEYFNSLPPEEDTAQGLDEDGYGSDDETEKPKTRAEQLDDQVKAVKAAAQQHQDTLKRTISYMWVAKLRAFRRIQGQGQPGKPKKGFRGVFAEARPRGQLTSEVYIASALMEWRCYQDPSASKIFERGLKLFPTDEVFALEYIKHLISDSDDTNARAVFETTMTKIVNATASDPEKQRAKCRPLLAFMHEFESNYGDLDKIHKLEKRMKDMLPAELEVSRFGSRFALPSFDGMAAQLVISPTQIQMKPAHEQQHQTIPSIEQPAPGSPANNIRLGPNGPYLASPKRALEDSDSETPQRKFMRGESPFNKPAAGGGRRMQNHSLSGPMLPPVPSGGGSGYMTKNYVPPQQQQQHHPTALPYELHHLLSVLPNARDYRSTVFNAESVVKLMQGLVLPPREQFGGR